MKDTPLLYAFGHLVSGHAYPYDAHSGDSLDLGQDTLIDAGYAEGTIEIINDIAMEVAANYKYTGELDAHRAENWLELEDPDQETP